ncbi:RagB/SusD family nutrient uptake outer membrane protein [Dysgonomonas sp. BGC7]|uniref:RagB/SusD family nutrient uptake outer membrane protein n=1 Tax=Dysgonomonas sp. BGC7 TaxID=1658008 RepID=UPI0006827C83|nr:RagB/SusD family nutrient uptake outer membrane protein [Dysgonomonas sp. BGC7]MBD8389349.1 RagB/SusD family nutrient uptake outer membrane protein [Dysgonomonas sp. BGC7]
MKTKIKYIIVLVGLLSMNACNDLLDLKPITEELETNYYKNDSECFQGLVSTYDVLQWGALNTPGTGAGSIPFEWISEIMGDRCYAGGDNATDAATMEHFNRGTLDGDLVNVRSLWRKYYSGIYRANLLLEKLPDAKFDKESNRERYAAEAKFLRAYFYFDLVRLFGNIPLITKTLSSSEYSQAQAAPEAVYGQIATDLQDAISVLSPYKELPSAELGRVTKSAAQGLLMRVWLYYTGYYGQSQLGGVSLQNILDISEELINYSGHKLLPDYGDLFSPLNKNNTESVFEIQFSEKSYQGWDNNNREVADGNLSVLLWSMRLNPGDKSKYADGWSFAPISKAYYAIFSDVDTRKAASFVVPKSEGINYKPGYQDSGIFPRKWAALKEFQTNKGDVRVNYPYNNPVLRFSDILLMASELNLKSGGDPGKALNYYKKVRERAMGASANVTSVNLDLLYTERDLEFACEGIRYWDLMRRGIDYAKQHIDESDPNGIYVQRFNYEAKGLLPIPTSEIINSKYKLKQNPGYL